MGYYDNHYPPNPHRKKQNRWLVPMLLGVVIGILLVVVALPAVLESDLVTQQQTNSNTAGFTGQTNGSSNPSIMNLDVTTQVTNVVQEVAPTVVGVTNIQRQGDFWEQQNEGTEAGTGSGVIYKHDGEYAYMVSNYHVVEGADELEIVLYNDTHVEAELLGGDLFSDLAVLRMDGEIIEQTIEMGSSANLKVGEPAIAIGNPLGHMFAGSVTQGIISGTQRTIPQDFDFDGRADWQAEVIQTDAAINPGNSGGALINMEGQLIGINSMKVNQEAVEGIGFSIPIDVARPIIEELETNGSVTRPYMGVEIYSLDEVPQSEWNETLSLPNEVEGGVYIWSVEALSPADQAGLERLDVITHLDGESVMNMIELRKVLYQEKEIGDEVAITYYRNGEKQETTITLDEQR
ncbi:S1C family serine protease [Oceanobacillus limi]|uniref:S1C family serine protease n=1 Tax=Oceanobacillus limi TaxID=930131 RepID=UPI00147FE176|nr:trypsin-like peptidase domain-containing protein [Oceanobacillus limi]